MESTFPSRDHRERSLELLAYCLRGEPWPDRLLLAAMHEDNGKALLRYVVERLGDLFEPRLCDTYAALFSRVIELVRPEFQAHDLVERYMRVRQPRRCTHEANTVYVLSRVTLGADVAVTSVVLDAVKQRFPNARIVFVGSRKNGELFARDERIEVSEFSYPRTGTLVDRLSLAPHFDASDSIVVDPDSRLTQLGVLPVCEESRYFFFESRGFGLDGSESLVALTKRWVAETFGVDSARPYIAPEPVSMPYKIAVSLGVGENPEKRISGDFEQALVDMLMRTGNSVIMDKGAGGEESDRVSRLGVAFPSLATWTGNYAPFASMISQADLYVGYDSAGQHVAAACGVPLISVFAGYASDRMFDRWRPTGTTAQVIKVEPNTAPENILEELSSALHHRTL